MNHSLRFGPGCLSSSPETFLTRMTMIAEGTCTQTQVMIIPEEKGVFQKNIGIYESYAGLIRIHAPHHRQGVNPCDPDLFSPRSSLPVRQHIEIAMQQTLEAADRTQSPFIVLHAGRYLPDRYQESVTGFHEFLDEYPDPRYILETLPILGKELPFLGVTPEELLEASDRKIHGYCYDLPHIYCTSQALGISYQEMIRSCVSLNPMYFHLSGTPGTGTDHQHLLLDDPENILPVSPARTIIMKHPDVEISIEIGVDDPDLVRQQLRYATSLFF